MKQRLLRWLGITDLQRKVADLEAHSDSAFLRIGSLERKQDLVITTIEQDKVAQKQRHALKVPWSQRKQYLEMTDGGRRKA